MKKVLFITYYWPPSGGAGVQRGLKFVKYLPEHGVQPIVLTVDPQQASYPSIDASLEADIPAHVRVIRTRSFEPLRLLAALGGKSAVPHAGFAGNAKPGMIQRMLRWIRGNWFIPDARRGWVKHAVQAAAKVIRSEGIDTIVISSPPHSSQLIGLRLKQCFPQLRWIADLRDPWTDIYFAKELMKGAAAQRRDAAWEKAVLEQADAIVVVGPSMKRAFADRYGPAVERRIEVITNGYDAADLDTIKGIAPPDDRFRIAYVGSMASSYNPRVFFEAVSACIGAGDHAIEIRFVGQVDETTREMARSAGVENLCRWLPSVSHDQALKEMAAAHLLLLVIPEGPGAERILTGKLFEYLGVRRWILCIGPTNGDAAAIIRATASGRIHDHGDTPGAISSLAAWISARAESRFPHPDGTGVEQYERRQLAGRLAALINGRAMH